MTIMSSQMSREYLDLSIADWQDEYEHLVGMFNRVVCQANDLAFYLGPIFTATDFESSGVPSSVWNEVRIRWGSLTGEWLEWRDG